jgi:hypothetical protein
MYLVASQYPWLRASLTSSGAPGVPSEYKAAGRATTLQLFLFGAGHILLACARGTGKQERVVGGT